MHFLLFRKAYLLGRKHSKNLEIDRIAWRILLNLPPPCPAWSRGPPSLFQTGAWIQPRPEAAEVPGGARAVAPHRLA